MDIVELTTPPGLKRCRALARGRAPLVVAGKCAPDRVAPREAAEAARSPAF